MYLYKLLGPNGEACNGGTGEWDLSGEWMPAIPNPELCVRGYHGIPLGEVFNYQGETLWLIEVKGKLSAAPGEVAAEQARLVKPCEGWNDKNKRLFACDCADHVLDLNTGENLLALILSIHVSREFAHGRADSDDLAAARDAARAAVWVAAWAAAGFAARAAAWAAARDATEAAAASAAWTAAGSATEAAERAWQLTRLEHYFGEKPF